MGKKLSRKFNQIFESFLAFSARILVSSALWVERDGTLCCLRRIFMEKLNEQENVDCFLVFYWLVDQHQQQHALRRQTIKVKCRR